MPRGPFAYVQSCLFTQITLVENLHLWHHLRVRKDFDTPILCGKFVIPATGSFVTEVVAIKLLHGILHLFKPLGLCTSLSDMHFGITLFNLFRGSTFFVCAVGL